MQNIACGIVCIVIWLTANPAIGQVNHNDASVFIRVMTEGGTVKSQGSGFLLGTKGFIVTAKHVIEDYKETERDRINVHFRTKDRPPVRGRPFNCANGDIDLCVIYVLAETLQDANITKTFPVVCRLPRNQEPITAVGFPPDVSPLISISGQVSSDSLGVGLRTYMTAPVLGGMSGGPILDKEGNVIGAIHGAAAGTALTMFTPILFGKSLLQDTGFACNDTSVIASSMPPTSIVAATTNIDITPAGNKRLKVYFQIGNENQREMAVKSQRALKSAGIFVPGIERISSAANLENSEVRYFSDEDEASANAVKALVESSSQQLLNLKKVGGYTAAPGLIEVWFGKN